MAERDLGSILQRFAKLLSEDPNFKGQPPDVVKQEALKRAKESLGKKPQRASAQYKEQADKAKRWKDELISADDKVQEKARDEAKKEKYPKETLAQAKDRLEQVEEVMGTKAPDWLKADTILISPQAITFAERITQLPVSLQEDPSVLYRETAKLYWSVDWSTATQEARQETRMVMDRAFRRIGELAKNKAAFGPADRSTLIEGIDNREHFHIEVPEPVESAGDPPKKNKRVDKNDPSYKAWAEKKISEIQYTNLKRTLDLHQSLLDLPTNADPVAQRKVLENLVEQLRKDAQRTMRPQDLNREITAISSELAIHYVEGVGRRLNAITERILKESARQQHLTFGELRATSWFTDKLSKYTTGRDDSEAISFRSFSAEDVNLIKKLGIRKAFYQFADRVFGLGTERRSPSLAQQYWWEDMRDLVQFIYRQDASVIEQELDFHWNERGRLDHVVQSIGLGPGDTKRRLESMQLLSASDIDYLNQFPEAEYAMSLMERETFGRLGQRMTKWEQDVRWLKSEEEAIVLSEDFKAGRNEKQVASDLKKIIKNTKRETAKRLDDHYDYHDKDFLEMARGEKRIPRDVYGLVLDELKLRMSPQEFAQKYQSLHEEIWLRMDNAARGVILEDLDVWGYGDIDMHMVRVSESIEKLKEKDNRTPQEDQMLQEFEERRERLFARRKAKILDIDATIDLEDTPKLIELLRKEKGLSPIEQEVYRKMENYFKIKGKEVDEVDIRMAIWAARTHIMGSGRMAAIGALMARMPGTEYYTDTWKHAMRAPAFEDLVRIMNPEMFIDRFNMAGDIGKVARGFLRFNLRRTRQEGGKGKLSGGAQSFFETNEWKALKREVQDAPAKAAMEFMEFTERDFGTKFTEILTEGWLASGANYDGSGWRLGMGVLDELREQFQLLKSSGGLPDGAILDNQGLAIRYATANDARERMQALVRMKDRTPSKFFQLLADKQQDMLIEAGLSGTDASWSIFERALSFAELDLAMEKQYATELVNLMSDKDFNNILRPYLEQVLRQEGRPIAEVENYHNLLRVIQARLVEPRNIEGGRESILDALAQEKLPLTLALDDFNWKDAHMATLGHLALPRRVRDIGGMEGAMKVIIQLVTNQENILSPDDPTKTIEKFLTLRDSIDSYVGRPVAEPVVKELARLFIEFNRDRSLWSAMGWLPGGKAAMKAMAELDLRPDAAIRGRLGNALMTVVGKTGQATLGGLAKLSHKVKPVDAVLNWMMPGWSHFSHEPIEHWPHSIAEAVSWSVRFTGAHGNHWNEHQINDVINTMHDMGLFTQRPDFIHDLRAEFKAGLLFRNLAIVRRYWWVVPLATIALATMQTIEEEKGSSKGGGH